MAGRLVTIATFSESAQAHVARSALEAAGIQVALNNEETVSLFGSITTALGGIRLVVREEDEEQAVKVLDDTFGGEPVDQADLAAQAEAADPEDATDAAEQTLSPAADPTADSAAREKDARVAFQAAAIGIVFPLATLFALVMILQASSGPGELSSRGRRNLYAAIALAFWPLALLVLAVFVLLLMGVM
jgi:hypothetical protein